MSKYNIKYSIFSVINWGFLAMVFTLAGCADNLVHTVEIAEVKVEIKRDVIFKPLVTTDVQARTRAEAPEGTEYKGIKSLYVIFFDSERQYLKEYSGYVDFTPAPSEGTHEHVTFKKKVQAGRYYVYAVANISDEQKSDLDNVKSIEALRAIKVYWNDDIAKDLEMFGVFRQDGAGAVPDNEGFEADEILTITPNTSGIHSWVRRAASKVTVGFDGTGLKEGVTVYIKNAVLKDVPNSAYLGQTSAVGMDKIERTTSEYSITYGKGESYGSWPAVTKNGVFSPSNIWPDLNIVDFHDDNAKALPCYENMQGEPEGKSKLQDSNGDGIIDSYEKDDVENGTYLEVEGYYVANRDEYKSQGKIIYRFMLGMDAVKNFDLVRNHHYKITMRFRGYGNDIDWHIDYGEKYLDATYPFDVNYQGNFLVPDLDYGNVDNAGHNFNGNNVITVTSYERTYSGIKWQEPGITYTYYTHNEQTGEWDPDEKASWLSLTGITNGNENYQKQYTFVAPMTEPDLMTINDLLSKATAVGNQSSPYNLSNAKGESAVENTANCYMVGAPGWYCLPLVYGNAITADKNPNTAAYSSMNIVNHLKKNITKPYIKDNVSLSNVSVKLIWQDAINLIKPSEITYDSKLFNGNGGIKFHIDKDNIQEGNAVIALIDNNAGEDEFVYFNREKHRTDKVVVYGTSGSTKAIWSWHIWVTRFGFGDFEKNIRVTNHDGKVFDVMPVNLGWCSGNNPIKYYKRRKCDITFKVGAREITRTIEQYPHWLLPRGDHPYYQWGRKDPFVGTNMAGGNKARWTHNGTKYDIWSQFNPSRIYEDPLIFANNAKRKHTKDCLDVLVKNPDKWHNAPRNLKVSGDLNGGFVSINESPEDLWSNGGEKTVYDPCPSGYQVGNSSAFSGFTTSGDREAVGSKWYDVLEGNMQLDYYGGDSYSINSKVLELYTDSRKIQSITFPVTGYRDYDSYAGVVSYPGIDAEGKYYNGEGYVWYNEADTKTYSYHLKFRRNDLNGGDWKTRGAILAPDGESFYNTNGFAVRPVGNSMK